SIKLLLEHGAEIDAADINGKTPLIHASSVGHENTVKVLLEYGAEVNAADNDGQ
ncbi:hypothetical protein M441DRAFT_99046, partial [Trichoderma asperellum CBS 433.97]